MGTCGRTYDGVYAGSWFILDWGSFLLNPPAFPTPFELDRLYPSFVIHSGDCGDTEYACDEDVYGGV